MAIISREKLTHAIGSNYNYRNSVAGCGWDGFSIY